MLPNYNAIGFQLGVRSTSGLAANFHAADREIEREMKRVTLRGARLLVDVTRALAPVRTGFMRDHVAYRLTRSGLGYEVGWYERDFIGAGLPFYPPFQEFGTRLMAAQPSLGPAQRYVEPIVYQEARDVLRAAIQRLDRGKR